MGEKGGEVRGRRRADDGNTARGGAVVVGEGGHGWGGGGRGTTGGTISEPLSASAAIGSRVAVPADLVVWMRSIAEEPGNTIVDLGFAHDKASGIGGGGGFVVASEGRKVSGGA